jgi:hypothetical protein
VAPRRLDPTQELGYYWLGVANDEGVGNVLSCRTTILHTVSNVESSCRITTVVSTRGGQQRMVAGGCTVATCWRVMPVLLVVVASVRRVRPLSDIVALYA